MTKRNGKQFVVQAGTGLGMFIRVGVGQYEFVHRREATRFTKIVAEATMRRLNRIDPNADDDYRVIDLKAK